ncbi:1-aminocyclopropane-1-carboxylate oxidase [Mercurialis annua]|uniref:1-aminocyclopropane-1-carboxylate oxidase n=1 Tax=Mercurialis annua TaxID=3986 RepID=UPI00215FF756|nr:1-aminocyclopropane-1-carboxylate oxidase [Mercurialis annua]
MAFSPEPPLSTMPENLWQNKTMPENNPIDFRAPPPSPVASGRRSSFANDDVLAEFLEHSLRVPDLVLPDNIFPRQKILETPPRIDLQSLLIDSPSDQDSISKIPESLSRIGCFQLVNHGIPGDSVRSVLALAAGIFSLPPEKRAVATRSPEKLYGFEEVHEEESELTSEEFVWCRDEKLKLDMEGIWPSGYSNFSDKMETLASKMENVAVKILQVIQENCQVKHDRNDDRTQSQDLVGSVCYLNKHKQKMCNEGSADSLGYDIIRMLIRGNDYSHALCFHACDGCSELHVYSKKGWLSFCPDKDAIIVTIGDQLQNLSGGQYRHVLGRAIFKSEENDCMSMAFLYSPPRKTTATATAAPATVSTAKQREGKTISLRQQVIVAIFLTLIYHFLVYVYTKV